MKIGNPLNSLNVVDLADNNGVSLIHSLFCYGRRQVLGTMRVCSCTPLETIGLLWPKRFKKTRVLWCLILGLPTCRLFIGFFSDAPRSRRKRTPRRENLKPSGFRRIFVGRLRNSVCRRVRQGCASASQQRTGCRDGARHASEIWDVGVFICFDIEACPPEPQETADAIKRRSPASPGGPAWLSRSDVFSSDQFFLR